MSILEKFFLRKAQAPKKKRYNPVGFDQNVYKYMTQKAIPKLAEAKDLLYYFTSLLEQNIFDDVTDPFARDNIRFQCFY